MKFSAVILCGGQSRRMGRDKAWIECEGEPLILRQLALLRQLEPEQLGVSIRPGDTSLSGQDILLLPDRWPGRGPLGGIVTALEEVRESHVLFLAVDMPRMTAGVLRGLLQSCREGAGVVPRIGKAVEPLAAVYLRASAHRGREVMETGNGSARAFAEACARAGELVFHDIRDDEAAAFDNWNFPDDRS